MRKIIFFYIIVQMIVDGRSSTSQNRQSLENLMPVNQDKKEMRILITGFRDFMQYQKIKSLIQSQWTAGTVQEKELSQGRVLLVLKLSQNQLEPPLLDLPLMMALLPKGVVLEIQKTEWRPLPPSPVPQSLDHPSDELQVPEIHPSQQPLFWKEDQLQGLKKRLELFAEQNDVQS